MYHTINNYQLRTTTKSSSVISHHPSSIMHYALTKDLLQLLLTSCNPYTKAMNARLNTKQKQSLFSIRLIILTIYITSSHAWVAPHSTRTSTSSTTTSLNLNNNSRRAAIARSAGFVVCLLSSPVFAKEELEALISDDFSSQPKTAKTAMKRTTNSESTPPPASSSATSTDHLAGGTEDAFSSFSKDLGSINFDSWSSTSPKNLNVESNGTGNPANASGDTSDLGKILEENKTRRRRSTDPLTHS